MAKEATFERLQDLVQQLQEADTPSKKFELSAEIARVSKRIEVPLQERHSDGGTHEARLTASGEPTTSSEPTIVETEAVVLGQDLIQEMADRWKLSKVDAESRLKECRYIFFTKSISEVLKPTSGENVDELLSERELEVLRRVASGHSNREIEQELFRMHIKSIFAKLGAQTNAEALDKARDAGLLS
jgi:ATP/maltotriose-dependent transcriptional regulator MalT